MSEAVIRTSSRRPGIIVNKVALSPDGSTARVRRAIASRYGDIYMVGVDGAGLQQLTDDPATDEFPQWSPDGTTIVYDNAGKQRGSKMRNSR